MDTSSIEYKRAFKAYMRFGTPIDLSLKQAHPTTHYIWRTRGDSKVRKEHAANNGKVFSWDNPPPTGHPGDDYGCRCTAEPYAPDIQELMTMVMSGISDSARVWKDGKGGDFENHYWNGNGRPVRLRDTGHLQSVVNEYWRQVKDDLLGQIANAARDNAGSSFSYDFGKSYPMQHIVFDLGDTVIGGIAKGRSRLEKTGALHLFGDCEFYQRDKFEDPLDIGIELPGSTIYDIFDDWQGRFHCTVNYNRNISKFNFIG